MAPLDVSPVGDHASRPTRTGRKLGRPRKAAGEARTHGVRVYLSAAELAEVERSSRAHGMRTAEYLRRVALGRDPRHGRGHAEPSGDTSAEVRFTLPASEKRLLEEAARNEGLFLGAYLCKAAAERGELRLSEPDAMRLIYELNAIGNNLNQAVRELHAGRRDADWEALRLLLDDVLTRLAVKHVR